MWVPGKQLYNEFNVVLGLELPVVDVVLTAGTPCTPTSKSTEEWSVSAPLRPRRRTADTA